jgi:hypothetical protein
MFSTIEVMLYAYLSVPARAAKATVQVPCRRGDAHDGLWKLLRLLAIILSAVVVEDSKE